MKSLNEKYLKTMELLIQINVPGLLWGHRCVVNGWTQNFMRAGQADMDICFISDEACSCSR